MVLRMADNSKTYGGVKLNPKQFYENLRSDDMFYIPVFASMGSMFVDFADGFSRGADFLANTNLGSEIINNNLAFVFDEISGYGGAVGLTISSIFFGVAGIIYLKDNYRQQPAKEI